MFASACLLPSVGSETGGAGGRKRTRYGCGAGIFSAGPAFYGRKARPERRDADWDRITGCNRNTASAWVFSRRRSSVGEMPGSRSVRPPEACSQGKQGGKYERTVRPRLSGRLWTEGDRSIASLAMQSGLAGLIPIVSCGPQSAVIPLPTGRRPYTGRPRTGRTSRRSCVRVVRSRPCGAYRPRPERRRLPRSFRAGAARGPTSE